MTEYIKTYWPVFITLIGWLYTLILDHVEVNKLKKDVNILFEDKKDMDDKLEEISMKLTEVSLKLSLLLDGKIILTNKGENNE